MKDVWIIGRGESVRNLKRKHIKEGLVIVLGFPISIVEKLNLPNETWVIYKDGASSHVNPEYRNNCPSLDCHNCPFGFVYPKDAILYVHENESIQCMADYPNRRTFDALKWFPHFTYETVMCAIELALENGYENFNFISFDAVTSGSCNAYERKKKPSNHGSYAIQAKRLKERVKTLPSYKFITP